LILIALLAAAAVSAEPVPAVPAPAPQGAVKQAEANPTVCRREAQTGSLFTKRTCLRKSQWEARARAASDMGAKIQGGSTGVLPN
jgi:hypothetical protein